MIHGLESDFAERLDRIWKKIPGTNVLLRYLFTIYAIVDGTPIQDTDVPDIHFAA